MTFLPTNESFVVDQYLNLCCIFFNKKLSTSIEPRESPKGFPKNLEMASREAQV
jgi:hypothetical protein